MMGPDEKPAGSRQSEEALDVYCSGWTDTPTSLMTPGPNVMGTVQFIDVKEGQDVKKGQILIRLVDSEPREQLKIARQELETAKVRLANAKQQANSDIKVIGQQNIVDRANAAYSVAKTTYQEAKRFSESNLSVGAKAALETAEINLQQAKKNVEAAEAVLAKLKLVDPEAAIKEFAEELEASKLKVQAAEQMLEKYVIKAPGDGKVVEINYQIGGPCPLPVGDANATRALVILPNEPLVVRAEVDQEFALLVNVGQKATLTFRAGAGREYTCTGKVLKVAGYLQRRRSRVMEPDQFVDTRTRECIVSIDPDPKNPPILHGMRVSVQIHTND
jgi:multidrug resistance efflux pump